MARYDPIDLQELIRAVIDRTLALQATFRRLGEGHFAGRVDHRNRAIMKRIGDTDIGAVKDSDLHERKSTAAR